MRFGEAWTERHNMDSLRLLGTVGEPINPEAWRWYRQYIGKERCPVMDTWWQTETGGFMITPTPVVPLKPGSGTLPFAGIQADVVREDGTSADADEDGYLVIKHPWPGMACTVWATQTAIAPPTGATLPPRAGTLPATAPAATPMATSGSSGAWTM